MFTNDAESRLATWPPRVGNPADDLAAMLENDGESPSSNLPGNGLPPAPAEEAPITTEELLDIPTTAAWEAADAYRDDDFGAACRRRDEAIEHACNVRGYPARTNAIAQAIHLSQMAYVFASVLVERAEEAEEAEVARMEEAARRYEEARSAAVANESTPRRLPSPSEFAYVREMRNQALARAEQDTGDELRRQNLEQAAAYAQAMRQLETQAGLREDDAEQSEQTEPAGEVPEVPRSVPQRRPSEAEVDHLRRVLDHTRARAEQAADEESRQLNEDLADWYEMDLHMAEYTAQQTEQRASESKEGSAERSDLDRLLAGHTEEHREDSSSKLMNECDKSEDEPGDEPGEKSGDESGEELGDESGEESGDESGDDASEEDGGMDLDEASEESEQMDIDSDSQSE